MSVGRDSEGFFRALTQQKERLVEKATLQARSAERGGRAVPSLGLEQNK